MHAMARRLLDLAAWALAVGWVARLLRAWGARLTYPYDLEWMEGGMLAHAWRLARGEPLYVSPNPDFIPFVYPPGYASVLASLSGWVGLSPALGRAVSAAGTLAAAAAIAHLVRGAGGRWVVALGAAAAFLGTYPAGGAFFDLVRPDGLLLGLLAGSVALAVDGRRGTATAAGLLLAAAFLVKHNAAVWGVPLMVGIGWRSWRGGLAFMVASAGPALGLVAALQWRTEGRLLAYLIEVPASHPRVAERLFPGTLLELGQAMPALLVGGALWGWGRAQLHHRGAVWTALLPACAGALAGWWCTSGALPDGVAPLVSGVAAWAVVVGAFAAAVMVRQIGRVGLMMLGVVLVAAAMSAWMRAHNGGYLNVHLPMFWAVAAVSGLWLVRAPRALASLVLALQLVWAHLHFDSRDVRPTAADRRAGDALVAALRERPGPVLSPFAAWLPTYAGHPPSLHYMGPWDLDYDGAPMRDELGVLHRAVDEQYWPTVVRASVPFPYGLHRAYVDEPPLNEKPTTLAPKTGWAVRPVGISTAR